MDNIEFEEEFFETLEDSCGVQTNVHSITRLADARRVVTTITLIVGLTVAMSPRQLHARTSTAPQSLGGILGYPRIERAKGVCGGAARIKNTRIPVWTIVEATKNGATSEDLLVAFPSLNLVDVKAALSYAIANQAEIDADILRQDADD